MLVVKSILRGEFAPTRRKQHSHDAAADANNSTDKNCSAASLVSSAEVTTIASETRQDDEDDNNTDDDGNWSVGSLQPGDSFVLDVDWTTSAETVNYYHPCHDNHNAMDESLEDPYLVPLENVRRRLCTEQEKENNNATAVAPVPTNSTNGDGGVTRLVDPRLEAESNNVLSDTASSMPSDCFSVPDGTPENVKSLGAFQFNSSFPTVEEDEDEFDDDEYETDDDDDDDSQRPSEAVAVPPFPHFGPSSMSASSSFLESDDKNDTSHDRSTELPSTALVHRHRRPIFGRSRERRHAARARAQELVTALALHKQRHRLDRPMVTANLYLQLGLAQQQFYDFPAAISSFFRSAALYRHFSRQAALATVLEHAAVSYMQAKERGLTTAVHQYHKVESFHQCLHEALNLRKQELGPWHVDTVNTLQNLAKLLFLTGHPARAAQHYVEVVHLRKAIFGPNHPSTAVTAHCLGNAYLQAHDTVAAELWYHHALQIYNCMHLSSDNPAVAKLLQDRRQLECIERWMSGDLGEDPNLLFEVS